MSYSRKLSDEEFDFVADQVRDENGRFILGQWLPGRSVDESPIKIKGTYTRGTVYLTVRFPVNLRVPGSDATHASYDELSINTRTRMIKEKR